MMPMHPMQQMLAILKWAAKQPAAEKVAASGPVTESDGQPW